MMLVAAAILKRAEGYWMVRRGPQQSHAGFWEFPGGKVEAGETAPQALARELWEELAIRVRVGDLLATAQSPEIILQAYQVEIESGNIELREHDDEVTLPLQDIQRFSMTELDRQIVEQLLS